MKIRILSPWKQEQPLREIELKYLKRLKRYYSIEIEEIKGVKGEEKEARKKEGNKILSHTKGRPFIVALSERGNSLDSIGFSKWLEGIANSGKTDITFVVGGAAGLDDIVTKSANFKLSLSPMTFPHRLARVVLVEQIYRVVSLLKGMPYHK